MSLARWETVKRLFHEARERPPAEREAYLAGAAGDDPALVEEVCALLSGDGGTDLFASLTRAGSMKPLAAETRLGPYEIVSLIGAGGMGEVYKARDTRLGRTVAIKVLPLEVAGDPDMRRRFEREARAVSKLSHPHICSLYDVGEQDGRSFLVIEYLEGESLADRLRAGRLPLEAALRYAREIAEALAEAHKHGIVHRDLKPANVMVTKKGAKLLDFGVAKVRPPVISEEVATTTASALTGEGVIVGTPQYMAPEQLEGGPVDARTDIFAFGLLLYEMVTGRRAFEAPSRAALIAAILEHDPPPPSSSLELDEAARPIPAGLDRIVGHCLEKDPADRFQSAQDLAFDLEWLSTASGLPILDRNRPASASTWRLAAAAAVGLALGGVTATLIAGRTIGRAGTSTVGPVRVSRLTEFVGLEEYPALSPDGRSVAFAGDVAGRRQIWVRLLAGGPALQLTRGDADHLHPRWSRDSSALVYFSPPSETEDAGSLWQVSALGGAPRRLADSLSGADLSRVDDRMAFFRLGKEKVELVATHRDGSEPEIMAQMETGYVYGTPRWSPDGRLLAYERHYYAVDSVFVIGRGETRPRQVVAGLDELRGVSWLPDGSGLAFSSSQGSTIPYVRGFQLWSQRLGDPQRKQLTFGEVSYTHPDLDSTGSIVTSRLRMRSDLWRLPVDGNAAENTRRATPITRQTAEVRTPSVSPDGREVVYVSDVAGHSNLWVLRLGGGEARQLTLERDPTRIVGVPLWSPDGRHIAFYWSGETGFGYSIIQPDGSGQRQILASAWWGCWSPDGRWLYYQDQAGAPSGRLKKVPIDGGPPVVVRNETAERPALAPDGKTLYFVASVPHASGAVDYEIRSASPEDGPSRLLVRVAAHRMPDAGRSHPVVSPDGRWLAMPLIDGITTNIWAIATADGAMRPLTDFGQRPVVIGRRVSWSPDGRSIFAAVSEVDSDIVLLEGLTW